MAIFEGVDRNRNIIIAVAVVVVILVIIYLYTAGHLSGIVWGDTFTRASVLAPFHASWPLLNFAVALFDAPPRAVLFIELVRI